jgi:hypothetical protein
MIRNNFLSLQTILWAKQETILPSIDDQHQLANRFGGFFLGKIENIRNDLSSTRGSSPNDSDIFNADAKFDGTPLTTFSPVTTDEIRKILTKAPVKSCELDPIPTHVLRYFDSNYQRNCEQIISGIDCARGIQKCSRSTSSEKNKFR